MTGRPPFGHNGGPALDDTPPAPPRLPYDAACVRCIHWTPPSEREGFSALLGHRYTVAAKPTFQQ